jgi:hypothetical protein
VPPFAVIPLKEEAFPLVLYDAPAPTVAEYPVAIASVCVDIAAEFCPESEPIADERTPPPPAPPKPWRSEPPPPPPTITNSTVSAGFGRLNAPKPLTEPDAAEPIIGILYFSFMQTCFEIQEQ